MRRSALGTLWFIVGKFSVGTLPVIKSFVWGLQKDRYFIDMGYVNMQIQCPLCLYLITQAHA
jgi:hypothetical protein